MDDGVRVRRRDTVKGPPLRILSLDGGGVRGYSTFVILQELMHRTFVELEGRAPRRHEIPRPCDHFDLIVGTGTGGLIALMLGRLRLDLDTCKDVYVRMTRKVFETDKTFAGIPYRGTLFKASKLEEAIRECVAVHTTSGAEGNDTIPTSPDYGQSRDSLASPGRTLSVSSRYSQVGMSPIDTSRSGRWGDPNALLYDRRENRTKTAVVAVYKGTKMGGRSTLLRSYDSRSEPAPEFNCTIWQAGRATCATGLAFKPIQIGQSVFIDEGAGKYNPLPQVLDEAADEWPGREYGVVFSVGTGKRPSVPNGQQHLWWEGVIGGAMGDFAEARRRLINKIEGCEETHQQMLSDGLSGRGINPETYFRLNVEIGVGEFGMNEWNRLSDISTNTRMYLARSDVTAMNVQAAAKLAKIHFAKQRHDRQVHSGSFGDGDNSNRYSFGSAISSAYHNPLAAELPAEDVIPGVHTITGPRQFLTGDAKYTVVPDDSPRPMDSPHIMKPLSVGHQWPQQSFDRLSNVSGSNISGNSGDHQYHLPNSPQSPNQGSLHVFPQYGSSPKYGPPQSAPPKHSPPPLPPKTPLPYPEADGRPSHAHASNPDSRRPQPPPPTGNSGSHGSPTSMLPYPDVDGPPPAVNMARKPEFGVR